MNEINLGIPSMSRIRHFTKDIKFELHSLRSFDVIHVKGESNSAVHALAN
jgi:hypothetical protein